MLTGLLFFQNAAEQSVNGWLVTYFKGSGIIAGTLAEMCIRDRYNSLGVYLPHSSHICAVVAHDQNGDSQNTAVGGDQGQVNAQRVIPVSYTHLDVYKRQIVIC